MEKETNLQDNFGRKISIMTENTELNQNLFKEPNDIMQRLKFLKKPSRILTNIDLDLINPSHAQRNSKSSNISSHSQNLKRNSKDTESSKCLVSVSSGKPSKISKDRQYTIKTNTSSSSNKDSVVNSKANEDYDGDVTMNFINCPPIIGVMQAYFPESFSHFIYHTKVILENDKENYLIFVFENSLIFTHYFEDSSTVQSNPILYRIKFQDIFYKEFEINQDTGERNCIILQFYEDDLTSKREL